MSKLLFLVRADVISHRLVDWYINATLPGWGRLQLWQWRLCTATEAEYDRVHAHACEPDPVFGLCDCEVPPPLGDLL